MQLDMWMEDTMKMINAIPKILANLDALILNLAIVISIIFVLLFTATKDQHWIKKAWVVVVVFVVYKVVLLAL